MSARTIAALSFAAAALLACDNDPLNVDTMSAVVQQSQSATQLPFSGSYTDETSAVFVPPITLRITGTGIGHATQLGRFTVTSVDDVNTTTTPGTSTGTFNLTAANGDQLFAATTGGETGFVPPNVSHVTRVATIVGGTGRFATATGTFTILSSAEIDFAAGTSAGSGSFDGYISLNR